MVIIKPNINRQTGTNGQSTQIRHTAANLSPIQLVSRRGVPIPSRPDIRAYLLIYSRLSDPYAPRA
jgi:hypothetical protein